MSSQARYDEGTTGTFSGTLEDESGNPIPLANLDTLTLTLTDAATGNIINSRNNQNVKNANNVTVNTTTGALNWSIQTADTAMVDSTARYEEHIAEFNWTYETTKVGKHVHRMRIINFLYLCTVEDVMTYVTGIQESDQPFLEMLIEQISARAENECDRIFKKSTVASPTIEYLSPKEGVSHYRVKRFPIDSVIEIAEDLEGDFDSSAAYVYNSTDYGIINHLGLIKLRDGQLFMEGEKSVRIKYAGGLARDTGAIPFDLRMAAVRQVAFWFQRRHQIGVETISVSRGGREAFPKAMDLLPDVERVLALYTPIYI